MEGTHTGSWEKEKMVKASTPSSPPPVKFPGPQQSNTPAQGLSLFPFPAYRPVAAASTRGKVGLGTK